MDIIDFLAKLDGPVAQLRHRRSQARDNAQRSFEALFEPTDEAVIGAFTTEERYAVAAFVAGLHGLQRAQSFYADLLVDELPEDSELLSTINNLAAHAFADQRTAGFPAPYGTYREPKVADESRPGPEFRVPAESREALGARLSAAFEFAHLLVFHPRDARPQRLVPLSRAGWSTTEVVSLSQLISFLAFQLRVVHGLAVLAHSASPAISFSDATPSTPTSPEDEETADNLPDGEDTDQAFNVLTYPDLVRPEGFVSHGLGWVPWVPPVPEADLADRQKTALVDPLRAKSEYFRLLARDPETLEARTLTDKDIFYNTTDGLGRAEREVAAAATSRFNGCVYCASVHTGRALQESKEAPELAEREAAIARLCDMGVVEESGDRAEVLDLGIPLWNALSEASVALAATPSQFGPHHIDVLRSFGLDDGSIVDVINSAAFFNWANRLMLILGEPELPRRYR